MEEKLFNFKATVNQLKQLTNIKSVKSGESFDQLQKWGGLTSLKKHLNIPSFSKGISATNIIELDQRKFKYGKNVLDIKKIFPKRKIWNYFLVQYQDLIFQFLLAFAFIDILLGIWEEGLETGWIDGLIIIFFINIMMLGYAMVSLFKYNKFQQASVNVNQNQSIVQRSGSLYKINSQDIVVGDVIYLENGDLVPADGILIESNNIICDEGYYGYDIVEKFCIQPESDIEDEEEEDDDEELQQKQIEQEQQSNVKSIENVIEEENKNQNEEKNKEEISEQKNSENQQNSETGKEGNENEKEQDKPEKIDKNIDNDDEIEDEGENKIVKHEDGGEADTEIEPEQIQTKRRQKNKKIKKIYQKEEKELFVFSQSRVCQGYGRMLALEVGENSHLNKISAELYKDFMDIITPLQEKLIDLGNQIGHEGLKAIQFLFILMIVMIFVQVYWYEDYRFFSVRNMRYFLNHNLIICTLSVIIAIPESLSLIPYLFKALYNKKLPQLNILPYNSASLDNLGQMDTVVIDKTGIITENKFHVRNIWLMETEYEFSGDALNPTEERKEQNQKFVDIEQQEFLNLFVLGICMNSNADPYFKKEEQTDANNKNKQQKNIDGSLYDRGNPTDIGLLEFIEGFGKPYQQIRNETPLGGGGKPYLTQHNLMWTIHLERNYQHKVLVKGSFDFIKGLCQYYVTAKGNTVPITAEYVQEVYKITNLYEGKYNRRILLFAYKNFEHGQMKKIESLPYDKLENTVLQNLVLLGIVGLENPLKPGTYESIQNLNELNVPVRMVTQDSLQYATKCAQNAGILDSDKSLESLQKDFSVMTGTQLMEHVGLQENQELIEKKKKEEEERQKKQERIEKIKKQIQEQQQFEQPQNEDQLLEQLEQEQEEEDLEDKSKKSVIKPPEHKFIIAKPSHKAEVIAKNLKVLARANSEHKFCLQTLLQYYKYRPGITGNGENDIMLFNEAFLGLSCVQQGKAVDKQVSDLGLIQDSLKNIIDGIKFSRVMWASVKGYCGFYISVAAVTMFTLFCSLFFLFHSSVHPTYLILINILLDLVATLYFLRDYTNLQQTQSSNIPESLDRDLISKNLKRHIITQVIIQIIILGFSLVYLENYYGYNLIFQYQELETQKNLDFLDGVRKSIFHSIYIYLTAFSIIHFRQVQNNKKQGYLKNIFANPLNLIIFTSTIFIQYYLVQFGNSHYNLPFSPLTTEQLGLCVFAGSFSLIIGFVSTFILSNNDDQTNSIYSQKYKKA